MQIDFEVLKSVLAPLRDVGNDELTFDVVSEEGEIQEVTVRPLLPPEETLVQRFSQTALDGKTDEQGLVDRYAMLDFFDRFRAETLSYAIVQVNELDLREVEYVVTGEKTQSGKAVRIPKHAAMRKLLHGWSRTMLLAAFTKYGELLSHIEKSTENIVESEPSDLDAEIERAEKRLSELKEERDRRAAGDSNITADQVRAINDAEGPAREMTRRALQQQTEETPGMPPVAPPVAPPAPKVEEPPQDTSFGQETPLKATTAGHEEEWATFEDIPTGKDLNDIPEPDPEPKPDPVPEIVISDEEPPLYADVVNRPGSDGNTTSDPLGGVMDSFGDPDDPEVVAAEEQRLALARRKYTEEQARLREDYDDEEEEAPQTGRTPPHLRGQRPEMEAGLSGGQFRVANPEELKKQGLAGAAQQIDETAAIRAAEQRAAKRGAAEGTEIRPTETLSPRGRTRKKKGPRINKRSQGGRTNQNFRPPGG